MKISKMNINEFINYIITIDNVKTILNSCETQSDRGFIFERMYDIIIKLGYCPIFSNSKYKHLTGNVNNGKMKELPIMGKYKLIK